jgi:hypothetical protein
MPTSNFKWNYKHDNEELNKEEWTKERILKLGVRDSTGYLFDVNISYISDDKNKTNKENEELTKQLHDLMNQYPICPENISIKKDYLNEWRKKDYNECKITKLCCTLLPKNNYVINYRYLKLALSLGVKLEKVNRVLQYSQSDFMAKYIMKNTNLRMQCKNEFEKDFIN